MPNHNTTIHKGNTVKVDYTGSLDDGTIFDASANHGQPLEFEVGSGQVIKGFDDGVMGMKVGEEKDIVIPPREAYGDYNPQMIKKIPRDKLPLDQELKPGMMLMMSLSNGQELPVKIAAIDDKEVSLDVNHPLAGKTLHFKITIKAIS